MWVQLSSLSIVTAAGASTSLSMSPGYYLIDSGTSMAYLLADAFASFDASFCTKITAASNASMTVTCGGNVSPYAIQGCVEAC